jgi:histone H3/H4
MSADVLVVASKVKSFIKEHGECNTSAETIEAVSKIVEKVLSSAIQSAKAQGRKTVMARDVAEGSNATAQ